MIPLQLCLMVKRPRMPPLTCSSVDEAAGETNEKVGKLFLANGPAGFADAAQESLNCVGKPLWPP